LHRAPGPRGPGNHYAAPPGLVFWVNRESFTRPTPWHGCTARVKPSWLAVLFECMGRNRSLPTRRADIETQVSAGGSFFSSNPGAWRPRQSLCRPSGAGFVGKQRVVHKTHIVARASRPCGAMMAGDFVGTQGRNRFLLARRADIEMVAAERPVGTGGSFFS
jgi:hypothetical protein